VISLGVHVFLTDRTPPPDEVARAAEERGFESMFLPEHTHAPISGAPDERHAGLDDVVARMLDPLVSLAWAASVTTRLRIGTGVVLAAQHDPILLAKSLATLDHLSGGRALVGVGYGWNAQEMRDHGVDPKRRWDVMADHLRAMRQLWEDEVVTVADGPTPFGPCHAWPKPAQARLPVFLGGLPNERTFGHVLSFADGWLPREMPELRIGLPLLRSMCADAGVDPDQIEVSLMTKAEPDAALVEQAEEAGATRVIIRLDQQDILGSLDRWARVI